MKYKALTFDLDGTAIPIQDDGIPSPRVQQAVKKASEIIPVGIATSRPYHYMKYIFNYLTLTAPCIINGGSEILDPTSQSIIFTQPIGAQELQEVHSIAQSMREQIKVDFHDRSAPWEDAESMLDKALSAYLLPVTNDIAEVFLTKISHIPTISAHKMPAPEKNKFYVSINHTTATKQHGIVQVAEILHIEPETIISVGDGHNDIPLLLATGLKIAMGNATEDLKDIADYIAPSLHEDGLAQAIEKFVLTS